ncbi:hypothetical protein [Streptomyces olivochromogenes]|uniref:hypothetical protein n=1 Tax=Streptomyces olivochromogenes TaxID=1963 RepID=UPI001F1C6150|nr:hypothetical protein [Streptomyces olivochromogenes]MCF3136844.1 hypothetical protein [Streptomyces olivochromogenes]
MEHPEVELAQGLVRAELALREARRGGAELDALWAQVAEELRRLWDRFTGRSQPMPAGPDASLAGRPEADSFGRAPSAPSLGGPAPTPPMTAGPRPRSGAEASAHQELARLEQRIDQLPPAVRTAFEDAVLDLVRSDSRLKAAFEQSPESIPTVAKYAVNAQLRESLRGTAPTDPPRRSFSGVARLSPSTPSPAGRPRPPSAPAILGQEGRALLRDQVATSKPTIGGAQNPNSSSRPASPAPGRPSQNSGPSRAQ